jgi:hypothetical protein
VHPEFPNIDKVLSFDLAGGIWRAGVVKRENWMTVLDVAPAKSQKA